MTQIDELVKRARSVDEEKLNVEPWTCEQLIKGLADALEAQAARVKELEDACAKNDDEICQTLGKVLGYPWFKDDQKNFPGATEASGVCVGEHVAASIAAEAAARIATLEAQLEAFRESARGVSKAPAEHREYGTIFIITEYWFDAVMTALRTEGEKDGE